MDDATNPPQAGPGPDAVSALPLAWVHLQGEAPKVGTGRRLVEFKHEGKGRRARVAFRHPGSKNWARVIPAVWDTIQAVKRESPNATKACKLP